MNTQWTTQAPGLGDMSALASFSTVLNSDRTLLAHTDMVINRLHKSLDLAIEGNTLSTASSRMLRALDRARNIATSFKKAGDAVEEYQETVERIRRDAHVAELQREDASLGLSKTYFDSQSSPPSEYEIAQRDKAYQQAKIRYEDAQRTLVKIAERRQAADDKLIATLGNEAYKLVDVDLLSQYPTARNDWMHTAETYRYHYKYRVASTEEFSAEQAMKLFQENPGNIFPFKIDGAQSFVDGDTVRLRDTTGQPWPIDDDGWVRVSTTPTSVTFTVVSNDYFDGQGSTITFQTVESDGSILLEQIADAHDVNTFAKIGINLGGAEETWSKQASNFADLLENHRKS